jgi:4-amino-4-deoxychorismate lyase
VTDRVVAVLGRGLVPADQPLLRADDLGVLRGDGVFESMHLRRGRPWLLDEHLDRMAGSAARLDLDLPARDDLRDVAATAARAWPRQEEGMLRLVCTRGSEQGGPVTVYATVGPVTEAMRAARRDGVAVITVPLGVTAAARPGAPWLLAGAKSLSYAVNMASLRWAQRHGADDVLWLSADGYALEAPTSSLVWLAGHALGTVPAASTGILAGTTARWLLDRCGALGLTATERLVRPEELRAADGVWLTSSVRGCVPVRALDGADLPACARTPAMQDLLGYPR